MFTFAEKKGLCIPVEIKASHFGELEKIRQINSTNERWKPEVVAVENNSYQETLVRLMKEMRMKIPIRGLYTGSDKIDLDTGLPSLELEIENRMWLIPTAGHTLDDDGSLKSDGCPVCKWLEECFQYPIGLSDILMSWWIAREGFRSLKGFSSRHMLRLLSFSAVSKPGIDKFFKSVPDDDEDDED